jgi:hypothetical protein
MVQFENATNALVPAQQVFITDPLTNTLDWRTFELTEIAFGDHFIAVPPKTQHFETSKQLSVDGYQFELQIEAGIHLANGQVYARFRSLNATNGLPPTVDIGFLPPENGTGRGQGHIGYTIRPRFGLPTGTEIRNVASIQFDYNPPLRTDLVDPHNPAVGIDPSKQALVTIDADPPTSLVAALATGVNKDFEVSWSGADPGAGIVSYDIYVSTNGGPWTLWLTGATSTSAVFHGQFPNAYAFYSVAHDGTGNVEAPPSTSDAQTTVTFNNSPPAIGSIGTQTIAEGNTLNLPILAVDPDAGDVPTFTLLAAPTSMTINASSGIVTWTPSEAQGPGTNVVTVKITDNGNPPLSATNSFLVIAQEVNLPPVLIVPTNQIVMDEMTTLSVTNVATDPDIPSNTLTFSLASAPTNAVIDPVSGVFTWTPTEAQGPSTNLIAVRVTDNNPFAVNAQQLSTTNSFEVIVREVNRKPVLAAIPNLAAHAGDLLVVTNSATDPDFPTNHLTFNVVNPPAGASIDGITGLFNWTPSAAQIGTTNITVTVTDDGSPLLSDTNSFTVTVTALKLSALLSGTNLTLEFSTIAGKHYRVEFRDDLTIGSWQPVPGYESVAGTGTIQNGIQSIGATTHRFYRIVELP